MIGLWLIKIRKAAETIANVGNCVEECIGESLRKTAQKEQPFFWANCVN